ncbi:MAG: hypothetical protein AABY47_02840 [Pseudomonadota bacterium]
MKYPLLTAVIITLTLASCGDPKPGQRPPSLYENREGMLTDSDIATAKKQSTEKKATESAEKIYPADDPVAPHAKSDKELSAEKAEKAYPGDDPEAPHAQKRGAY